MKPTMTNGCPMVVKDFVTDYEVKIFWEMPSAAALDEVKYFEIIIGTGDQSVYKASADCDGRNEAVIKDRSCRVQMSMFWSGEYKKDQGTLIQAKVRAYNSKGWSLWSRANTRRATSAAVEKLPSRMQSPNAIRSDSANAIAISWDKVEKVLSGGADVRSYNLQYTELTEANASTATLNLAGWTDLTSVSKCYSLAEFTQDSGLTSAKTVYYRIRVGNNWGWGAFSMYSSVQTAKIPSRVPPVSSTVDPLKGLVKIAWERANDNGSKITKYDIEI